MDKFKNIVLTCVDFVIDKKRYFLAGLVCVIMVVLLAFGTDDSAADSNPLSGAYQAYTTETEDSEITNLLKEYYAACASNDKDSLMAIATPISDSELSYIELLSQYIDSYDILNVYSKRGADSNSYLVSAEVEIHFSGVSAAAPGLDFFYVTRNTETGKLGINNVYCTYNQKNNEYDMDPTISSLIAEFEQQDDLLALQADVQAKYNERQLSDAEFNTFTSETIPQAIQKWASDYKAAVAAAEEQAAKEAAEAEEAAKKAEEEAAAQAAAEEAAAQKEANSYTVKVNAKVNVRSSASTDSSALGKVTSGTELKAYSEEGEWTLVSYNGSDAYIKTEFLERVDTATATTEETTETQETTQETTTTANTYSPGDSVLLYTTVNVRESMSETAKKVAVAYAGEKVEVVMQYSDGWTKVKYKSKEGYIKSEFLGPQ